MRLIDLDEDALRQHGLITKAGSGWSHATWYRAIRRGEIEQLHPGVARLVGTPRTPLQRIAAAVWSSGGDALASHRSAAMLWGFPRPEDDPVDITLPGRSRKLSIPGIEFHRPTDQLRLTPYRRQGVRCTNVMRTLVDLGAVDRAGVHGALGHALTVKWVTLSAIEAVLVEHARPGRAGVTALRSAIDAWAVDEKPADSVLEPAFARLVARYDLPAVEFHPVLDGWEVDFRVVGTCLVLECDGWAYHGLDRSRFERDRRRDNDLAAAGWIVRRFTYRAIITSPARVARTITALVDRWADVPPPDA